MPRERVLISLLSVLALVASARAVPPQETALSGPGAPQNITCATLDQSGALWVGTEGEGLRVYDPARQSWDTVPSLVDQTVFALVCDRKNRIWAGHLNHGVTVLTAANGEYHARNFDHWGKSAGPLGARVYALAVSPADGDVWIATEEGLTRYSESKDAWTHYNRAPDSGALPTNMFRGIAFDKTGDLYLATASDGILIGRAADDFAKWEQITGPADVPLIPHGPGLPAATLNCITTDARGVVYAGTTRGLAVSADHGKTWRFVRGKDWAEIAKGSYAGVPPGWTPRGEGLLNEDWITSLHVDASDMLWVGFRHAGYQLLNPQTSGSLLSVTDMPDALKNAPEVNNVPKVVTVAGLSLRGQAFIGRYAGGAWVSRDPLAVLPPFQAAPPLKEAALPQPNKPITARQFDKMLNDLAAMNKPSTAPAYLGEDWETQGDWVGRYGRQFTTMNGLGLSTREFAAEGYRYSIATGPHFGQQGVYGYVDSIDNPSRRVLYDPTSGKRAHGENNDGSFSAENYPATAEGPDLWIRLALPKGMHRVSLYFMNIDGQVRANTFRDLLVELRQAPKDTPADDTAENLSLDERFALYKLPVLARARVSWFFGGVYQSFLVRDQGVYWIKIARNHSFVCKVNGVFVDRLDLPPDKVAKAFTFHAENNPPVVKPSDFPDVGPEAYACKLWSALDQVWGMQGAETLAQRDALEAYRVLAIENTDRGPVDDLLRLGRWKAHLWNPADRDAFDAAMQAGYQKLRGTMQN